MIAGDTATLQMESVLHLNFWLLATIDFQRIISSIRQGKCKACLLTFCLMFGAPVVVAEYNSSLRSFELEQHIQMYSAQTYSDLLPYIQMHIGRRRVPQAETNTQTQKHSKQSKHRYATQLIIHTIILTITEKQTQKYNKIH